MRTADIARCGARVLRFRSDDVLRNPAVILQLITEALFAAAERRAAPHPHPLPQAGEGAEPNLNVEVPPRHTQRGSE